MATLAHFVARHNIVASAELVDGNPHCPDWHDANHYRVTLRGRFNGHRRQLTVLFSMGYAHTSEPTAADVLDCLASDAVTVDCAGSFENWAADLGYDTDSRKAERTYRICQQQAEKLRAFLGEHYSTILYQVERL